MAEPTNTPMPTAPGTPISLTPRSASPVLGGGSDNTPLGGLRGPSLAVPIPIPLHVAATLTSSASSTLASSLSSSAAAAAAVTAETVIVPGPGDSHDEGRKPRVLHIGDPIRYNPETWAEFAARFDVVRPATAADRERAPFLQGLRDRRWGDFDAVYRPFWGSGGEMGRWDAELIALLPDSVKVFASAGAGYDWADVELLGERGIIYCNSGVAAADAVADFAVIMIISTFRMLPYCISSATSSSLSSSSSSSLASTSATAAEAFRDCHARATAQSHNLRGRTLGLAGLGNIGESVARRMRAGLGMEILYHDTERKSAALESELRARFCASLDELVGESDCVVLCTPAGAGQIVDRRLLTRFRAGGRLVNVARGSLVDEEALADALDAGALAAVALDVHADEPRVNPRLLAHAGSRALLTCHNAGGTVETHAGFEELGMRNIMAVLGGREPITPVNLRYLKKKKSYTGDDRV